MRKIKDLKVKKCWAKSARRAMFCLRPPNTWYATGPIVRHGWASGCCSAFGYNVGVGKALSAFSEFIDPPGWAKGHGWWWPKYYQRNAVNGYTARIIALESFALYCEEHGV